MGQDCPSVLLYMMHSNNNNNNNNNNNIRSRAKMAALGYAYTLRKQTLRSPERCTSRNATSAEFLEVQIPPRVLVYVWDP